MLSETGAFFLKRESKAESYSWDTKVGDDIWDGESKESSMGDFWKFVTKLLPKSHCILNDKANGHLLPAAPP